jgi:hypothetical protein
MKRLAICLTGAYLITLIVSLQFGATDGDFALPEAQRKAALAQVAKAWSLAPKELAAGWGMSNLPLRKVGAANEQTRTAREGLPPRLSLLLLGQPGAPKMALVTLEVLSVPKRLAQLVRAYAGEVLSLPSERIVVVATHTHAGPRPAFGPALQVAFGAPEMDEKGMASSVAYAANEARKTYARARLGHASSRLPTYIANRSHGATAVVDDRLRCLVLDVGGRALLLWSYAAHPTLVARHSSQADGDYPARVAAILEQQGGIDQVVFLPGRSAHATVATERNPERLAEVLAHALRGLELIATNTMNSRVALSFSPIELPEVQPLIPLFDRVTAAPWLSRWLGDNERSVSLLRLGSVGLTFVSGEVSNGLVPSTSARQWVVSLAGSGLGYLVLPKDRNVEPERPFVLLNDQELTQIGELLRIVSRSGD